MRERVFGLDLLRALAVLGVVLSHGFTLILPANRIWIERYLAFPAYFGVEAFFVLSGFLIGSILLHPQHTANFRALKEFWIRRWFRTLPNYYFILVVTLGVTWWLHRSMLQLRDLLDLVFLQNLAWAHSPFFGLSWSLAVEEWFYLLFPLAIVGLRCGGLSFDRAFILASLALIVLATLAKVVAMWLRPELFWEAHYWKIVVFRLDAVMFGVLAARLKQAYPGSWYDYRVSSLLVAGGLLGFVVAVLDHRFILSKPIFNLVVCPLTSLGMACALPFIERLPAVSCGFLAGLISRIALYSYSIYLLNSLICDLLIHYADSGGVPGAWRYGLFLVFVLLCYWFSQLNYLYFEKPILAARDRFTLKPESPCINT